MYGIGQFAQLGQVSVRTLRHYDDIGLLRPGSVDEQTGYRSYSASQLTQLNRILALKDLGFTLAEITRMVEAGIGRDELAGMLRLRRAEAERRLVDEERRLARVAARLALLQGDSTMSDLQTSVVVKRLDPLRVAVCSEPADGFDVDFAPIFERLYPTLFGELGRAGVAPAGPAYGLYEAREDGRIDVMAASPIAPDVELSSDVVTVRDLGAAERAATLVHSGAMENVAMSYDVLDRWMQAAGERPVGLSREVYLDCPPDRADWVTELQFVLA